LKKFSSNGCKCYIEVKGCAGKWNGSFHLSENEVKTFRNTRDMKNLSYVVVVIDYVEDWDKIKVAKIINWTEKEDIIELKPEAYLATIKKPSNIR
jgi:hypothetical protein